MNKLPSVVLESMLHGATIIREEVACIMTVLYNHTSPEDWDWIGDYYFRKEEK